MIAVSPSTSLSLEWNPPTDNGCLPIIKYILNKDSVDLAALITADQLTYTDNISTGGTIGTSITYMLKAVNEAGLSLYTEPLIIIVGQKPNPPTNLRLSQ